MIIVQPGKERAIIAIGIAAVALLAVFALFEEDTPENIESEKSVAASDTSNNQEIKTSPKYETSSGWTVTSYQDVNEAVYSSEKIEVFDSGGNSLGFYKSDFLEQVKIDGSGKGDGIQNSGKYLHYDYDVDDGKTYYLADKSLGAYGNELIPWDGDRPSIAVNPPLPLGTAIRFIDLGSLSDENPEQVIDLLKTKTFYADDKFSGETEKRIDVYVGLQKTRDMEGTPESLWMTNVTVYIERQ